MTMDFAPAARTMSQLLAGVTDEQLTNPTPCPDYRLGDLIAHVDGLVVAFTAAARKDGAFDSAQGPSGDGTRLGDDWRDRIDAGLDRLVEAWRDPAAWEGTTRAGGITLSGSEAGVVAMDELVIHGWDVARASGQDYQPDPESLAVVEQFVAAMSGPENAAGREGLFGPEVEVASDAPLLDRVVAGAGRHPDWRP